jgi:protein LSM14
MNPYMGGNMYMQPPPVSQQLPHQQQQPPFQPPPVLQQPHLHQSQPHPLQQQTKPLQTQPQQQHRQVQPQQPQQHQQPPKQQQQQQQQPPLQQQQQQPQQQPQQQQPIQGYWKPTYTETEVDQLEKDTLDELKAELAEADALQPNINEATIEELAKKVSELNPVDEPKQSSDEHRPNNRRHDHSNHRGKRHSNDRQVNHKNKNDFNIPSSEFDFEASNAKFDKNEVIKKDEGSVLETVADIPPPDSFYNKVIDTV